MWSYYGAKTNIIDLYPPPKFDKIIEPFAGTARYALKYWERDVLLVDKYEVIIKIWKWLQLCSPTDILKLPRKLTPGMRLSDFTFDCEEAKMLMGFLVSKAVESPRNSVTNWVAVDRPNFSNYLIKKIANNLHKIKHWNIQLGTYHDIPNGTATWFIDPPYKKGGECYVESSKNIDYDHLSNWCKERTGHVMVCENSKADWLPFKKFTVNKSGRGRLNMEAIWSNYPTPYDNVQLKLL